MLRTFLPPVLTGLLLWVAFFPLDLGPVGFVALVPWLALVRAPVSRRRRYFGAYVGGFAFFALATNWVRVAHPMMYLSWAGLSLVLPLFWVLGLDLIRRFDRLGVPLALSVPVAWVALEYMRMHFPTGFPFLKPLGLYQMIGFGWYSVGYTQHAFLPFIQVADLGGVYAVSFLVAAVNGMAADWAFRQGMLRRWLGFPVAISESEGPRARLFIASSGVCALVCLSVSYGMLQLEHPEFTPGPRVAAIQGSVPQGEKMQKGDVLGKTYDRLYGQALFSNPKPDLIVWPETCVGEDWLEIPPGQKPSEQFAHYANQCERLFAFLTAWFKLSDEALAALKADHVPEQVIDHLTPLKNKLLTGSEFQAELGKLLSYPDYKHYLNLILQRAYVPVRTSLLLGLTGLEWEDGKEWKYNSALMLSPRGFKVGRYDKMHLVPFGEYVPFKDTLPFMQVFTPYKEDYSCRPGEHWTRFPLACDDGRTFTFACLVCYEDSDPYLARQYVAAEPVEFFVNISNDGWFDGTEEHEQHLAICRFRAIEARRSIVRSVNMGISAVIDSDGRVVSLAGESWAASKKVEAVVSAVVPIDNRKSWYSSLGDWIPAGCWLLVLAGFTVSWLRRPNIPTAHS